MEESKMTVKKIEIERKSIPRSYRDYLKKMVEMGEFFEIDSATTAGFAGLALASHPT